MAIQACGLRLDDRKQELAAHGTPMFPCACYSFDLNDTITGDIPWHWHEEIELVIVHRGAAQITAGNLNFNLLEGEGVFINSNVLHSGHSIRTEKCIIHSFVFHSNLICGSVDNVFMQKYIHPLISCSKLSGMKLGNDSDWQSQTLEYIRQTYEICQNEEFGYEFTVRDLLSKVCILIEKNNRKLLFIKSLDNKTETNRIKKMLSFIQQHYNQHLELKQIADCVNVSQRECLRCFRKELDISPMQYLIKYRISASAQLLMKTDLNITEICERCGFTSPSYFSKMFKHFIGCSPSKYQKQR